MKVVVLAGGISTERDVSLSSGEMIYKALVKKHQTILLDVYLGYEDNEITDVFDKKKDWLENTHGIGEKNPDLEEVKSLRKDDGTCFFGPNVLEICQMADVVFLALHGQNGEDGKIQATFELLGIPFTGTDSFSSAIAMDKRLTKEIFTFYQIKTPRGYFLKKGEMKKAEFLPSVVKTSCGGSSVGVYIAHTDSEYEQAVQAAFSFGEEIVVEEYIKGREFAVGVLDGEALPVIEIAPLSGFYDYKNKYQAGSAIETCPADLPTDITLAMQREAEAVFQVLRLRSYARMDFLLKEDGSFYCLEANTLPGMTKTSLLPQEAAAVGMNFEALCEKIISLSFVKKQVENS